MGWRYKRTPHYVWCDVHCAIHEASPDVYGEGLTDCRRSNWRSVAVFTEDPNEEF